PRRSDNCQVAGAASAGQGRAVPGGAQWSEGSLEARQRFRRMSTRSVEPLLALQRALMAHAANTGLRYSIFSATAGSICMALRVGSQPASSAMPIIMSVTLAKLAGSRGGTWNSNALMERESPNAPPNP